MTVEEQTAEHAGPVILWADRYGPGLVFLHAGAAMLGLFFAAAVWRGGSPITPELYGPVVYQYSALSWAMGQVALSCICIVGAVSRGTFRTVLLIIGGFLATIFYVFLSVAAAWAAQGTIVQGGALFTYAAFSAATFIAGVGTVRYGRK